MGHVNPINIRRIGISLAYRIRKIHTNTKLGWSIVPLKPMPSVPMKPMLSSASVLPKVIPPIKSLHVFNARNLMLPTQDVEKKVRGNPVRM